jgi:hypothetical protein
MTPSITAIIEMVTGLPDMKLIILRGSAMTSTMYNAVQVDSLRATHCPPSHWDRGEFALRVAAPVAHSGSFLINRLGLAKRRPRRIPGFHATQGKTGNGRQQTRLHQFRIEHTHAA